MDAAILTTHVSYYEPTVLCWRLTIAKVGTSNTWITCVQVA